MSVVLPLHGGQLSQIARHFRLQASDLLDFSANINPEGPPTGVSAALRESLDDLTVLTTYPQAEELALRQALATYAGVTPENIIVGNGFVPILDAALRAMPVRQCLIPVPAFTEYRRRLT